VRTTIVWPSSIPTCGANVNYSDIGEPGQLGCGEANFSADPQFTDTAARDYNPPARIAGAHGGPEPGSHRLARFPLRRGLRGHGRLQRRQRLHRGHLRQPHLSVHRPGGLRAL
jgi:hypothetical protein